MNFIKKILCGLLLIFGTCMPNMAFALDIDAISELDISGLVPIVLDSFMFVAQGTYEYFVGSGGGLVYLLVLGFFIFFVISYLIKLYIPKFWLSTFGFKSGDSVESVGGMKIAENLLKPALRAIIALTILLQLRPEFIAKFTINPFLHFGAIYTEEIINLSSDMGVPEDKKINCSEKITTNGWLDQESCEYLTQPVRILAHANNAIVKRGFRYLASGLGSLRTLFIHDGGQGFMGIITGLLLISTFVACNVFMSLLIIQAIFNFGMALILYPFSVAAWVAHKNDSWFDIWPAFSGIINALKQTIITMIACAFILCVNLALVRAIFQWNNSAFVAAAGGIAYSNLPPTGAGSSGFGGHSMVWLSCILTFFLMNKIFEITREKLNNYVGKDADNLYKSVKTDAKTVWGEIKSGYKTIKNVRKAVGK